VWWVELDALTDARAVGLTLAHSLGVRPGLGQSGLDAVVSYLARATALVVLDNCEHVISEAALVVEALTRQCPGVSVVATSREPLRVSGETEWRVPSMAVPPVGDDAVRLFVERAAKVRPNFRLSEANAGVVERACHELDGIPLAIELAAALVRVLSVQQIAESLADRFGVLTRGMRGAVPRQRTLRASVDWSHDQLCDAERVVFRRLGVFSGGCTLDAATRVCCGDGIEPGDVFGVLAALVDKSLVQAEERGVVVRYRLLETLRQYAVERLTEAGETERVRDRLRDWYLEWAEQIAPDLVTERQLDALALLDPESANFTQAIGRAAQTEPDKALRLGVALTFWWRIRGLLRQGDAALGAALDAAAGQQRSVVRARALWSRAYLWLFAGEFDRAVTGAQQALVEAERTGDQQTVARSRYVLGNVMMFGDPAGSRPLLEQARDLAAAVGDEYCRAMATVMLANSFLHLGEYRRAEPLTAEAARLGADLGLPEVRSWCWGARAWIDMARGDLDGCRAAAAEAIASARTVGDVVSELWSTALLALLETGSGRPEDALRRITGLRERALALGAGFTLVLVELVIAVADLVAGRLADARSRLSAIIDRDGGGTVHAFVGAHFYLTEVLRLQADTDRAEDVGRLCVRLAEQKGSQVFAAMGRVALGQVVGQRGDWAQARQLLHEGLAILLDSGYGHDRLLFALDGLAAAAEGLGNHVEAARLLGAAMHIRAEGGLLVWPSHRAAAADLRDRVCAALGVEAFGRAVTEGRVMPVDEVVAYVRRARGARDRPRAGWDSLTPTEHEVVRQVADGLTNPEIAARMFVSRGTVKNHLSHVYAKLGVKSRSELAAATARRSEPQTP
jgi:predicted ATPase/DNA-binding CsgD family transcriptional regulator